MKNVTVLTVAITVIKEQMSLSLEFKNVILSGDIIMSS